jgi:hypothetical protein
LLNRQRLTALHPNADERVEDSSGDIRWDDRGKEFQSTQRYVGGLAKCDETKPERRQIGCLGLEDCAVGAAFDRQAIVLGPKVERRRKKVHSGSQRQHRRRAGELIDYSLQAAARCHIVWPEHQSAALAALRRRRVRHAAISQRVRSRLGEGLHHGQIGDPLARPVRRLGAIGIALRIDHLGHDRPHR